MVGFWTGGDVSGALDSLLSGGAPPIGTPLLLGTGGSGTGYIITTSAPSPATNLIVMFTGSLGGGSFLSVTDQVSNAYTGGTAYAPSACVNGWYKSNATALPSGNTITGTFFSGSPDMAQIAASVSGIKFSGALDNQGAGATGASTSPSVTEGTVSIAKRIVFGFIYVSSGGSDAFTEASGWTTLGSLSDSGGKLHVAYKVMSAVTAQTYNPTLGTSRTWTVNTISFEGQ